MVNRDTVEVLGAHVAAVAISFTTVENSLKIISLVLAIAFTLYKFHGEYHDRKSRKK
jgi:EamA domain-containing membrane protein RarD